MLPRSAVRVQHVGHPVGGKMNVLREQGFTFDMGPTILTMPNVVRAITSALSRPLSSSVVGVR
ncbi:MAG: hypothetical protein ACKOJI_05795, partial [Phycisphaerales bacterium]